MTAQLQQWSGEFGQAYTDRNRVDWHSVVPMFKEMLDGIPIGSTLEVGCNRGHNLCAIESVLGGDVVGIEPNPYALGIARQASDRVSALRGNAFDLPFKDGSFDLVLTAGVLIHISLEDLPKALREIHRVSRKWILAVEYFDEQETEITYRDREGLLWKRNFLRHYQTLFPGLKVVRNGYWEDWDRSHWWLMEKQGA